jgi:pimeloyl-ACP methyl ester carboxylesterase
MYTKHFIFLLLFLSSLTLHAQNLKQKGSFGVGYYQITPDSLVQKLKLPNTKGTLVQFVVPNSTAEGLQLQANDWITEVNGKKIETPADFLKMARQLRADDNILVSFLRENKPKTAKGTVKPKPMEQSETADIVYGDFAFDGGQIRTILKKPKNQKPLATVFYLQGISCYSVDNMPQIDPTRQFLDGLVDKGFAVFRVEKAGMGDSQSPTPCVEMGFEKELELFKEGYRKLLTYKELDEKNIFLFGHSMGGIVAPLLAETFQPKGVIVYGTVLRPWHDYLLEAIKWQSVWSGADLADMQDTIEMLKPTFYELFYNKAKVSDLAKNPKHSKALEVGLNYDKNTNTCLAGRTLEYHVGVNQARVTEAWKNTTSHVLAMYGEADIAAIYPDDHELIAEYVNKHHAGHGTFYLMPKTNHGMQEIGTMEDYLRMQADPQAYEKYASEHFNPKMIEKTAEWILSVK